MQTSASAPQPWSHRRLLLLLSCIALLLCVGLAVHWLQRWKLEFVLREREKMALEMHDMLAQSFAGITYQLNAAKLERRGGDYAQMHITHALQMIRISHKEVSRTIASLRPQCWDAIAILHALQCSAERLSDGNSLKIATRLTGPTIALPVQVRDALFLVGRQAISNAIQHAACTVLTLELTLSNREAKLCVHDDGCGFNPNIESDGLGLTGMRRRAESIKAHLLIAQDPRGGTKVSVNAPIPMMDRLPNLLRDVFSYYSRPSA